MGSGFSKKKKEQKIFQQIQEEQEALSLSTYEGSSGNGLVSVIISGNNDIIDISINPECIDPEEAECIADLIKAAHKNAKKKLDEKISSYNHAFMQ